MREHGGNLLEASVRYGLAPREFLDFSANINPLGPPKGVFRAVLSALESMTAYPDPHCRSLRTMISRFVGVRPENIIVGNGAAELIGLYVDYIKPERVVVIEPTFSEYSRAALIRSIPVATLYLSKHSGFRIDSQEVCSRIRRGDLLFLCNPNNPTGNLLDPQALVHIIETAESVGARILVDESFIDFLDKVEEYSLVNKGLAIGSLMVIRSFTKFFAFPGLRLGYGVGTQDLINDLWEVKDPWSVNSLAQEAGIAALQDLEFREKTLMLVSRERAFLLEGMAKIRHLTPYPSSANFILVAIDTSGPAASQVRDSLGLQGILVRDCSNFPGLNPFFFRIAVRDREANTRLLSGLRRVLEKD